MFLNAVASALLTGQSEGQFPFVFRSAESSAHTASPTCYPRTSSRPSGATPSVAFGLLSVVYMIASLGVYLSLIYQISARTRILPGLRLRRAPLDYLKQFSPGC